jgi:hypothetical protein
VCFVVSVVFRLNEQPINAEADDMTIAGKRHVCPTLD